jgi:DNA repair exonuclease SbcCD nuclease subunit
MRFLHTADWHWGDATMHPLYRAKFIKELAKLAKKKNCQFIAVAGDIFDHPQPKQQMKDMLVRQLLDASDIHFVFSVGNHDYTTKERKYHSLIYLELFIEATEGEVNFSVVTPGNVARFDNMIFAVADTWEDPVRVHNLKKSPVVVMWHGIVPGLTTTDLGHVTPAAKKEVAGMLTRSNAAYLALGDIHKHIQLHDKCWYPGPPVQKTYSDVSGVVLVDLEAGTTESLELPLPKRLTYEVIYKEGKDSEDALIEDVIKAVPPGSLLKLKFNLPLSTWSTLRTNRIKEALSGHYLEVVLHNDPIAEKRTNLELSKFRKAMTKTEEIQTVLETFTTDLDKQKLFKICTSYVKDD